MGGGVVGCASEEEVDLEGGEAARVCFGGADERLANHEGGERIGQDFVGGELGQVERGEQVLRPAHTVELELVDRLVAHEEQGRGVETDLEA